MEGDPFLQTEICVMDSVQLDQHILGDYVSTMVGTYVCVLDAKFCKPMGSACKSS